MGLKEQSATVHMVFILHVVIAELLPQTVSQLVYFLILVFLLAFIYLEEIDIFFMIKVIILFVEILIR